MASKSAEMVASDQDILTEILVKLPIKSLFRFKCVSKPWLRGISSTHFAQTHTIRNPNPSISGFLLYKFPPVRVEEAPDTSIVYHSRDSSSLLSHGPTPSFDYRRLGRLPISDFLKISPDAQNLKIVSSCNGLLLCSLDLDEKETFLVSNPTTKDSYPMSPLELTGDRRVIGMTLAFDPMESHNHKVVCFWVVDSPAHVFGFEIYSSETGSWTSCERTWTSADVPQGAGTRYHVYWKGAIHYLYECCIYLTLGDESLKSLPMPPVQSDIERISRRWDLGQYGGRLHLVQHGSNEAKDSVMYVYDLRSDYSGWNLLHRIYPSPAGPERRIDGIMNVLDVVLNGNESISEIVFRILGSIISYNPVKRTSKVLLDFNDDLLLCRVVQIIQTLAPV